MRNKNAAPLDTVPDVDARAVAETPLGQLGLSAAGLPRTRPVYRHIAQAIEHGITTGTLALDFRLPAERELAQALKVSRTTVVNAYRDLETRGLVRGHVGRGTFVSAAPESSGAPFAWRGKVAAAASRSNDGVIRDLLGHAAAGNLPPRRLSPLHASRAEARRPARVGP